MKLPLVFASLLLAASSASATVTLQFNSVVDGSLQNFANTSGVGGSAMVWGLIIDTAGNGFSYLENPRYSPTGLSYTTGVLQTLSAQGSTPTITDDVLFLSPVLMNVTATPFDGMPAGTNRVTTIVSVPYGPPAGVNAGDAFAVVWLSSTVAPNGSAIVDGTRFGAVNHPGLVIPADGATVSFASLFAGADPLKQQNFIFTNTPEPSSALLGVLGAMSLLLRRRP